MELQCLACRYKTTVKCNMIKHENSEKHLRNQTVYNQNLMLQHSDEKELLKQEYVMRLEQQEKELREEFEKKWLEREQFISELKADYKIQLERKDHRIKWVEDDCQSQINKITKDKEEYRNAFEDLYSRIRKREEKLPEYTLDIYYYLSRVGKENTW